MTLVLTMEADSDTYVLATSDDLERLSDAAVLHENDLNHVELGEEGAVAFSAFELKRDGYWSWTIGDAEYFITEVPHV